MLRTFDLWPLVLSIQIPAVVVAAVWWRRLGRAGRHARPGWVEFLALFAAIALAAAAAVFTTLRPNTIGAIMVVPAAVFGLSVPAAALLALIFARERGKEPSKRWRPGAFFAAVVLAVPCALPMLALPTSVTYRGGEAANVVMLGEYARGQDEFRRSDRYGNGLRVYANPKDGVGFPDLYQIGGPGSGGGKLVLIDETFARARDPQHPRCGYYLVEITGDANGPYDYTKQFGVCGAPADYGRYGRFTVIVNAEGVICSKNTGGRPVTTWPDVAKEGWIPIGEY